MATRRDIREAFQSELQGAVPSSGDKGHVPSDHITIEGPDSEEDLPAVVHNDSERRVPMNQASTAPTRIERDADGDATAALFGKPFELRFSVLFWFISEDEKEDCYEAVRSYFEKYEDAPWDPSTIQSDIYRIRVSDAQNADNADLSPARRGDRLLISFYYLREQEATDEAIAQVDHEVDADDDGAVDVSWSTT